MRIGIPVVLQSLVTIGVNMTDTVMIGYYGEIQISASSLSTEFINIFQILCYGIGGGAGVLTAQYWGSQDIPALRRVVSVMLWIVLSVSVLFSVVTALFPGSIIAVYAPNDPDIIQKGSLYLRMSAASFPLMGVSLTLTAVLRTVRQVRIPLFVTIGIFFANIFGNWVFIFGNLGFREMQIEGAALSTLICRGIECAVILGYFLFADQKIGYRARDFFRRVSRGEIALYIRYSVPVIISDFFLATGNSAISMVMGRIGASFVAANAILVNVARLSTVFTYGVANASGIITGNTLGAGDRDKTYRQGVTFFAFSVCLGLVGGLIVLAGTPIMLRYFHIQEETRVIAHQLMYALVLMVVFQAIEGVMTKGVLRGGGDTRFLMIADVLFLWIASIPLGYLAGLVLKLSPFIVYIALKIDLILKSTWCFFRLRSKKWLRRVNV